MADTEHKGRRDTKEGGTHMRNIQKQLCGIAVMLFGLIITIASFVLSGSLVLIGGAVGLFGLGMTFWNQDDDEEKTDADDNGK